MRFGWNGHCFIVVSDQADFLQGRCTTPESFRRIEEHVQNYLKAQKALLLSIQGEMVGHAGEVYFAVIKPTAVDHRTKQRLGGILTGAECPHGPTDIMGMAATIIMESVDPGECHGFILDMRTKANVEFLRHLLANENVLKAHGSSPGICHNLFLCM